MWPATVGFGRARSSLESNRSAQDLRAALERNPRAKRAFEALSYSRQQRYTLPIEKAKTADTRDRNVHKAIRELQKG